MGSAARGVGAVLLLCCSNAFMNCAWYLHLKFKSWPIYQAIFLSWLIAFFEYVLQVPANRMGHFSSGGPFTAPQLKTIQEFLSLSTFAVFSIVVLKEKLRWPDALAFGLIFSGVLVGLLLKPKAATDTEVALPPPPVAPAPEPPTTGSAAGSPDALLAAPGSSAEVKPGEAGASVGPGPGAEEPSALPPAPSVSAGRKLLQLVTRPWQRSAGSPRSSGGVQLGLSSQQQGQQQLGEDVEQARQQQGHQEQRQGQQEQRRRTEASPTGGSSGRSGSQQELLPARQELQSEGSAAVLLASGWEGHISSSRQGTHFREHSQAGEAAGTEEPQGER